MAGKNRQSPQGGNRSLGTASSDDPTTVSGQYGPPLPGGSVPPKGTGAAGTQGGGAEPGSVSQPGQVPDSIFGVPAGLGGTGAPGSAGGGLDTNTDQVTATFTDMGKALIGDRTGQGGRDSASAGTGVYPNSAQLPGLAMPSGTGAGQGSSKRPTGKSGDMGVAHRNAGK